MAESEQRLRVAILTVSDRSSAGLREDGGGPAIREALAAAGVAFEEAAYEVTPDEQRQIGEALVHLAERPDVDVVLTTGGTGLAPRDVTPQATRSVLDYEIPGIGEALRVESLRITPMGMLSRATAGVRGRVLIVNLPGNPKAVRELIPVVAPVLGHAVETLRGQVGEHSRPGPQAGEG